eukprot:CAMPEP_0183741250 /NCGR_PEP_ID=MMETSP0737-20130205/61653_1 /TAXON_ID=385413 /ORGANISM="Thalassiosira miniscula, Strain CCMP1093" /LENGTH=904 /DNA_ID=CAMNT_0025976529 /DNA_START=1 /DNA_END=2715 /DNA_ORIENTATION=-
MRTAKSQGQNRRPANRSRLVRMDAPPSLHSSMPMMAKPRDPPEETSMPMRSPSLKMSRSSLHSSLVRRDAAKQQLPPLHKAVSSPSATFKKALSNGSSSIKQISKVECPTAGSETKDAPLYQKGMNVFYHHGGSKNNGRAASSGILAHIVDVHFDDLLEPYYTIVLEDDELEKQTDNDHLSPILLLPSSSSAVEDKKERFTTDASDEITGESHHHHHHHHGGENVGAVPSELEYGLHVLSLNKLREKRKKMGLCPGCGEVQTRTFWEALRVPNTVEGLVYKGICIKCNTLDEAKTAKTKLGEPIGSPPGSVARSDNKNNDDPHSSREDETDKRNGSCDSAIIFRQSVVSIVDPPAVASTASATIADSGGALLRRRASSGHTVGKDPPSTPYTSVRRRTASLGRSRQLSSHLLSSLPGSSAVRYSVPTLDPPANCRAIAEDIGQINDRFVIPMQKSDRSWHRVAEVNGKEQQEINDSRCIIMPQKLLEGVDIFSRTQAKSTIINSFVTKQRTLSLTEHSSTFSMGNEDFEDCSSEMAESRRRDDKFCDVRCSDFSGNYGFYTGDVAVASCVGVNNKKFAPHGRGEMVYDNGEIAKGVWSDGMLKAKDSQAHENYKPHQLPGYSIGDVGRNEDMTKASTVAISKLHVSDCAWIRRSNRTWTYAIVKSRSDGDDLSITFQVNHTGSTKTIGREQWKAHVRLPLESSILSGYSIGDVGRSEDMIIASSKETVLLVSKLWVNGAAFVRRSNGSWVYGVVTERTEGDDAKITFKINQEGHTKTIQISKCGRNIRCIKHDNIDPPSDLESKVTGETNSLQRQDREAREEENAVTEEQHINKSPANNESDRLELSGIESDTERHQRQLSITSSSSSSSFSPATPQHMKQLYAELDQRYNEAIRSQNSMNDSK